MKAQWLMIGGVALFVISWAAHDIFKIFTSGLGATVVSLLIFLSPVVVLLGIVIFILSHIRKGKPPQS